MYIEGILTKYVSQDDNEGEMNQIHMTYNI